jgi:hypothetical protein
MFFGLFDRGIEIFRIFLEESWDGKPNLFFWIPAFAGMTLKGRFFDKLRMTAWKGFGFSE